MIARLSSSLVKTGIVIFGFTMEETKSPNNQWLVLSLGKYISDAVSECQDSDYKFCTLFTYWFETVIIP